MRALALFFTLLIACDAPSAMEDADGADAPRLDGGVPSDAAVSSDASAPLVPPPRPPAPEGCIGPGFDPLTSWAPEDATATVIVTNNGDRGPGSLREALANAEDGDVVGFDASLAGATIAVESTLDITASITLDGSSAPGLTLDGQGAHRIVSVGKNLDSRVVGLRFVRGFSDGTGGAIRVRQADPNRPARTTEVVGCVFEDNVGTRAGALGIGFRVNAHVTDSVFRRNDATSGDADVRGFSGGAIATQQGAPGGIRIERCLFEQNRGWKSGAVYSLLEPFAVFDSVFLDNQALDGSGALFSDGGNPAGPRNDPDTGSDGRMHLEGVWLEGNVGQRGGGAVLLWGYPRDQITLLRVVARSNVCEGAGDRNEAKGGVARLHGLTRIDIRDSAFVENRAAQQGGALWVDGAADLHVVNTTFARNEVTGSSGGGFVYNGRGSITVESAAFVDNRAAEVCGAFCWGSRELDVVVRNTAFVGNESESVEGRHVRSPRPVDGGGNLEFVEDGAARARIWASSRFADPGYGEMQTVECTLGWPPAASSPLVDGATEDAPERDATGHPRTGAPDIGPLEAR